MANDGAVGDQHLRNFQDNEKTVPTVLTTSQKLSTGVDALNIRHIVLMCPIRYIAATTYWSADGRPITAAELLKQLFGDLADMIANEDQLRAIWAAPENRQRFLEQLDDRGYDRGRLNDIRRLIDAPDSDLYDVLGYVLYANSPKTRRERANDLRRDGLKQIKGELRQLLLDILQSYETHGERDLEIPKLASFLIGRYDSVSEGKSHLGELPTVQAAFRQMQTQLYAN